MERLSLDVRLSMKLEPHACKILSIPKPSTNVMDTEATQGSELYTHQHRTFASKCDNERETATTGPGIKTGLDPINWQKLVLLKGQLSNSNNVT